MKVSYLAGMRVSASGLAAQRTVMNTVAENLANAQTTRSEDGEPYRRKVVALGAEPTLLPAPAVAPEGALDLARTDPAHRDARPVLSNEKTTAIEVAASVSEDPSEFPLIHDPGHPDAGEDGMVRMPNVETAREMVTLLAASRAYEANVAALQTARRVAEASLNLAR